MRKRFKGLRTIKFLIAGFATISVAGCITDGSTQVVVTCGTIKFVCLSRKDTQKTKEQVAGNNGALLAICPNSQRTANCKKQ